MRILNDSTLISDFTRMRYVLISDDENQNGWTIASDNYTSFPNSTAINISSLDWFLDASKGNYGISDVLNSVIKDETFFSIYYPVYNMDNKLIGAINGVLYPDNLKNTFNLDSFNGYGKSMIIESDGSFVYHNSLNGVEVNNFFELDFSTASESIANIKQNFSESKSFMITVLDGTRYVEFRSIGINDWYLVASVTQEGLTKASDFANSHLISFIITTVGIFALIITGFSIYAWLSYKDSTKRLKKELDLERKNKLILNSIDVGAYEDHFEKGVTFIHTIDGMVSHIGTHYNSIDELLELTVAEAYIQPHKEAYNKALETKSSTTFELCTKNGRWFKTTFNPVLDKKGNIDYSLCIVQDIHESKLNELTLEKKASCDDLTGLLTREAFISKFNIYANVSSNQYIGILDVDYFKAVNDNYGHQVGDKVLVGYANALNKNIKENDFVCRLGGDEFILFLDNYTKEELEDFTMRLTSDFKEIGNGFETTASIGYKRVDTLSLTKLYKEADDALYKEKNRKKSQLDL